MKKIITFTLVLAAWFNYAMAQAPFKFNYQGIARNATGQPLASQNLGIRISIMDGTPGGTNVYTETHTVTTNAYGLYTLPIGGGTVVSGAMNTVPWNTGDKFIKVEIDPAGGTTYADMGTTQLLSVPYALSAGDAKLTLPYSDVQANTASLFKIENTGDGAGIEGINSSTTANAAAIKGVINNTSPGGFSSGVRGINNSTSGLGIGVYGSQAGSGWGVYGTTPTGIGVYGNASGAGIGVYAASSSGLGLNATSSTGSTASFQITNNANTSTAVIVQSNGTGRGISLSLSNAANGNRGLEVTHAGSGPAIFGSSTTGFGVWGISSSTSSAGVIGDNTTGEVVVGRGSAGGSGVGAVVGRQDGPGGYGVRGFVTNSSTASIGVLGQSGVSGGIGSAGRFENVNASNTSDALQVSSNAASNGVYASVVGSGSKGAVYGISSGSSTNGVVGEANTGASAYGIWGKSTSGYAGYFSGNVYVAGTLGKSAGTFKIDHPADPANKYLIHSFVESPDMMNVYNGNITTDAAGTAVVDLPAYFEIENIDFKYQLTVIGQFAQAIISKEVNNNKFEIKTSLPNVKVSWQVTGVRNDRYAQQHRVVPEVEKTAEEKGYYLNPDVYGLPETQSMPYSRMRGMQVEAAKPLAPTGAEKVNTVSNKKLSGE